jgi:hypothetical protein
MKKLLTLAALVGVSGVANAAPAAATLTGVTTYSANGSAALNISASTATWEVDTATGVATQTGGTFSGKASVGKTLLYTQTMTGGVLSSGAATGTSWGCAEGIFGGIVGAHICGNFTLGGNGTVDSIVGNSGTAVTVVIGGDDVASGDPQTLANSYSNMTLTDLGGGNWRLSNSTGTSGYDFNFNIAAAPNALPVIADGSINTYENTASAPFTPTITLGDGTDAQHTLAVTTDGTNGSCVVTPGDATGTVVYTPDASYTGTDSCVLTLTDTDLDADTATISVTVNAFGANDDSAVTTRGQPVVIAPGGNDAGFDETIAVSIVGCTEGGTAEVTAGQGAAVGDIRITYTPAPITAGTSGNPVYTDVCTYTLNDGVAPADDADISIDVSNSVPNAIGGAAPDIDTEGLAPASRTSVFTAPGTGGNLGNTPVISIVATDGATGTTSVTGNVITYTPDADFFVGSDSYTYTITDLDGETSTSSNVTVTIADVLPTIADGAITTTADTASDPLAPTLTAGNGSPAQHTLAVTTDGINGNCTLSAANATGTVTYTPDAGYTGEDSCVVTLTDGDGDADTATINVTVEAEDEITLPGGSSSMDLWSLSLLGSLPLLMRRRRRK